MIPVVSADRMQELDRVTIHEIGIPGAVLMESAGRATFEAIMAGYADRAAHGTVVLCGKGNNGGDGFVIARWLHNAGVPVQVLLLADGAAVAGDAAINFAACTALDVPMLEVASPRDWPRARRCIARAGLIVDALLGTGLSTPVRGTFRRAIEAMNASGTAVVAVDVPSGLDATSGAVLGAAVQADMTCTFGLPKSGLVVHPGAALAGDLRVVDIGIPPAVVAGAGVQVFLLEGNDFEGMIPQRPADSHKGMFGHVAVLAGSTGMVGAACMTARAALRAGAGLVTLGAPAALFPLPGAAGPEVMTAPLPDAGQGGLGRQSLEAARALIRRASVVALGPGLSVSEETARFVTEILSAATVPVVVDADALTVLARDMSVLGRVQCPVVLTPHPGEMARLAGSDTPAVQADRLGCARALAGTHGVFVVLKGARTVIAAPDGRAWINPTGNPVLACGGMGDVLTGMIAGLSAQGLEPLQAVQCAVYTHGRIGGALARQRAPLGVLAGDVIECIPQGLRDVCFPGAALKE